MSRTTAATLNATEGDHQKGRYRTSVYLDSDDVIGKLSKTNNRLVFDLPQQVENISALKMQNLAMTQTISPFDKSNRYLRFGLIRDIGGTYTDGGSGGYGYFDMDLAIRDVAYDRQSIDQLGVDMTNALQRDISQNPGKYLWAGGAIYSLVIETIYVRERDAIEFRLSHPETPITGWGYKLIFPIPENSDVAGYLPLLPPLENSANEVFGLTDKATTIDGTLYGNKYQLGVVYNDPYANTGASYKFPYDVNYYSILSNAALRLEGNPEIIIKMERCSFRSAHSATPGSNEGDEKSSNIFEKTRLGSARGSIVQYTDSDFPVAYYSSVKSLQGQIIITFWTGKGEKPAFQYNTHVHFTLYVEYNDD